MLKKFVSEKVAVVTLGTLFSFSVVLHMFALAGLVSPDFLWGGRTKTKEEFLVFESISLTINVVMLLVILVRTNLLRVGIGKRAIRIALWVMFVLFTLNTVGNVLAIIDF